MYEAVTAEDRERLYHFRYQVFTQEQSKYVKTADHQRQVLVDVLDDVATHLVLEKDGEVIGSLRQIRGVTHATAAMRDGFHLDLFSRFPDAALGFSGRLLVMPEHRGTRALLELLIENYMRGRAAGLIFDFINCNPHLVRFYEQMGYRRYCSYYYDPNLGFQVPLVLISDDQEHLQSVGSIFAAPSRKWPTDPRHREWVTAHFGSQRSFVSPSHLPEDEFAALLSEKINQCGVPLFEDIPRAELDELLQSSTHLSLAPGTKLVREGDMGPELYVILDGVVEVQKQVQGSDPIVLATLGRGDTFGEMSVLTGHVRSSDVVTVSTTEVIFFDRNSLTRLVKAKSGVAARLLLNLSRILAERLELMSRDRVRAATEMRQSEPSATTT